MLSFWLRFYLKQRFRFYSDRFPCRFSVTDLCSLLLDLWDVCHDIITEVIQDGRSIQLLILFSFAHHLCNLVHNRHIGILRNWTLYTIRLDCFLDGCLRLLFDLRLGSFLLLCFVIWVCIWGLGHRLLVRGRCSLNLVLIFEMEDPWMHKNSDERQSFTWVLSE